MSDDALEVIDTALTSAGINYMFDEWKGEAVYPYYVGLYTESEPESEDGMQDTTFILTGFTRGNLSELEATKKTIKRLFHPTEGLIATTPQGAVAIFYERALNNIPTGDAELKKIEIYLSVKEWSV